MTCHRTLHPPKAGLMARWTAGALLGGLLLASGWTSHSAEQSLPEYQVKAAWLLNFARFIDWPTGRFNSLDAPIVIGVVGADPFGRNLELTFKDKNVKGRAFLLQRLSTDQDLAACHIIFVSASERRKQRELCEKLKAAGVLTVGDNEEFLAHGGMINFVAKDASIRFNVNLEAAQAAGLKLSSQLLKVAVTVKGKYAEGKE